MTFASTIGLVAGIIGFIAFAPYIIGILNRTIKPNKATWLIWAVLGIIIAASYYASGARDTAWTPISYALGATIIAVLSVKYGEEGWTALDRWCLVGAGAGLALWAITKEPVTAYYLTTIVDAIGAVPTIKKAWEMPESERNAAWPVFFTANVFNIFAITEWTVAMVFYPVYVFVLEGTMTLLVYWPGRRKKAKA